MEESRPTETLGLFQDHGRSQRETYESVADFRWMMVFKID